LKNGVPEADILQFILSTIGLILSLGKKYETKKLVQLKPNEKAVVFGTIYKQQELKPSILREISDEVLY